MSAATWLVNGRVVTPSGIRRAAVGWKAGRIVGIAPSAPRSASRVDADGQHVAPGLIDLHLWGEPDAVASEAAASGVTAFLTTFGPCAPERLVARLLTFTNGAMTGPQCLGVHLEGPFVNPKKAGALPPRWMRPPVEAELQQLARYGAAIRMITIAPELPGALDAIRWCRQRGVLASLGHTDADAMATDHAIRAGARAVTHVFNAMRPYHHREPGLVGVALTDERLAAMVILDGHHIDRTAFRLLLKMKGPRGVVLVTDSIRHQQELQAAPAWGAYYTPGGALAGSRLTMIEAVRNAAEFAKISLVDAVQMASANPARLLRESSRRGSIEVGKRADLIVFDNRFRVSLTIVGGQPVFQRSRYNLNPTH